MPLEPSENPEVPESLIAATEGGLIGSVATNANLQALLDGIHAVKAIVEGGGAAPSKFELTARYYPGALPDPLPWKAFVVADYTPVLIPLGSDHDHYMEIFAAVDLEIRLDEMNGQVFLDGGDSSASVRQLTQGSSVFLFYISNGEWGCRC